MRITEGEAEEYLRNSLTSIEQGIGKTVTVSLNQNEFDALVSFAYNVGSSALYNSTLIRLLNSETDKKTVAAEFFRWDKVNGKPILGLTRRRKAEHDLFLTLPNPIEMTSRYRRLSSLLKRNCLSPKVALTNGTQSSRSLVNPTTKCI